jgi:hypothetical protein
VPPIVPRPDSIPGTLEAAALFGDHDEVMPDPRPMSMEWDEVEPTTISKGLPSTAPAAESFESEEEVTRIRQDEMMPGRGAAFQSDQWTPVPERQKPFGWHETTSRPPRSLTPRLRAAGGFRPFRFDPTLQVKLVAAVVGVLVLLAGVLYWSHDRGVATIRLATDPRDAVVRVDGQRVGSSASPFVLSNLDATEEHTVSVDKPGYSGWSTTLKLRPDQVLDLPVIKLESENPPPRAAGPAPLTAASLPPAALVPSPAAPAPPASVPDSAPPHEQPRSRAAAQSGARSSVASDRSARAAPSEPRDKRAAKPAAGKRAAAEPAVPSGGTGTLRVNTRPWSRVVVDGRSIGNTPQMSIQLRAGRHTLKLVNPEFGIDKNLTVEIKAGEITTRVLTLQ